MRTPFAASLLTGSLTLALSRRERGEESLYPSPLEKKESILLSLPP